MCVGPAAAAAGVCVCVCVYSPENNRILVGASYMYTFFSIVGQFTHLPTSHFEPYGCRNICGAQWGLPVYMSLSVSYICEGGKGGDACLLQITT